LYRSERNKIAVINDRHLHIGLRVGCAHTRGGRSSGRRGRPAPAERGAGCRPPRIRATLRH